MKKLLFLLIFAITTSFAGYSQDTIVRTNGAKIICKIQKEDSSSVYFSFKKTGVEIKTFINISEISSIRYSNGSVVSYSETKSNNTVTATSNISTSPGIPIKSRGIVKPNNNCDKIILKSGDTLYVDVSKIDTLKIYYAICDSSESNYSLLKRNVYAVKYSGDNTTYINNEMYGNKNNNSFGWKHYGDLNNSNTSNNEAENSTITRERRKYYQHGEIVSFAELKKILSGNSYSTNEFHEYKVNSGIGTTLEIIGLISVTTGAIINFANTASTVSNINNGNYYAPSSIGGGGFILLGGAFVILSIPFLVPAKHHLKKAINLYNSEGKSSTYIPVQYNLMMSSNGLGIRMRF